ncbi:MAG: hypothetical protein PVF74_14210, partial [Anaerolineales bacterium]
RLELCHSTGVISFFHKSLPSTGIAGGFLFRASRPQLAKAINQNMPPARGAYFFPEAGMKPFAIEPPVEVPGWGQIHENIIEDEVTWAEYALETGGALYAFSHWDKRHQEVICKKAWRSEAALDLYLRITREMGEILWPSKS